MANKDMDAGRWAGSLMLKCMVELHTENQVTPSSNHMLELANQASANPGVFFANLAEAMGSSGYSAEEAGKGIVPGGRET